MNGAARSGQRQGRAQVRRCGGRPDAQRLTWTQAPVATSREKPRAQDRHLPSARQPSSRQLSAMQGMHLLATGSKKKGAGISTWLQSSLWGMATWGSGQAWHLRAAG